MGKVLILDDDIKVRDFCYSALAHDGHKVFTAPCSEEVYHLIKIEKPDLVLADLKSAGIQGFEMVKHLSDSHGLKIPVVIFSNDIDNQFEKDAYQSGAIEVWDKNLSSEDLRLKVDQVLSVKHRLFSEPQDIKHIKLMIIDDEPAIRHLLTRFFEIKGLRVLAAENGEEGLLLTEKEKPDVVLLDVLMPGMDGILTLKKIRELDDKVGVLMMTSVRDPKVIKQATELGAFAYILKPFDVNYLEVVVMSRISMAGHLAKV